MRSLNIYLFLSFVPLFADCDHFTIGTSSKVSISTYLSKISELCELSIIIEDKQALKILDQNISNIHLQKQPIKKVLDILLLRQHLYYTLDDAILSISYLQTKTYKIDYIISNRLSTSQTDISFSNHISSNKIDAKQSNTTQSGIRIQSKDNFNFWNTLQEELNAIIYRPEDKYQFPLKQKYALPVINKEAGLLTVTATHKQHTRLKKYLYLLNKQLKKQVLIDMRIYSVSLNESHQKGINWKKLFSLQNFNIKLDSTPINTLSSNQFNISSVGITLDNIIGFLNTQGKVFSISNPKILTLNNQSALISVGDQIFYKLKSISKENSSNNNIILTQTDSINSIFAGILLDITPQISDNNTITLKINPSLSQIKDNALDGNRLRDMPPDLSKKQLSSVISVVNEQSIVLGGLINKNSNYQTIKIPILSDIPLLGSLFSYTRKNISSNELVIIITPHIILDKNNTKNKKLEELQSQLKILTQKETQCHTLT